jgi:hypothetical protein
MLVTGIQISESAINLLYVYCSTDMNIFSTLSPRKKWEEGFILSFVSSGACISALPMYHNLFSFRNRHRNSDWTHYDIMFHFSYRTSCKIYVHKTLGWILHQLCSLKYFKAFLCRVIILRFLVFKIRTFLGISHLLHRCSSVTSHLLDT